MFDLLRRTVCGCLLIVCAAPGGVAATNEDEEDPKFEMQVYPVRDLVVSYDQQGAFADFDSLIEVITGTLAPSTWSEVGGAGSIKPFFNSQSLVISQTKQTHQEIATLLASLRHARDVQGLSRSGRSSRASFPYSTATSPGVTTPASSIPAVITQPVAPTPSYVAPSAAPAVARPAAFYPTSRLVRVYD